MKKPTRPNPLLSTAVINQAGSAVTAVAGVFSEAQRTEQVKANAEAEIVKAVEETNRTRIKAKERIAELVFDDMKDQRRHTEEMARLQNQAQELANARDRWQTDVEMTIIDVQPRGLPAATKPE